MARRQLVSVLHHIGPQYNPNTIRYYHHAVVCARGNLPLRGSLFEGGVPRSLIEG